MSSLRLEEVPFELEGKTYMLRCNMAALEAMQEEQGGDFASLLDMPATKSTVIFLAAMLNVYAEEQRWPERWDVNTLKRKVSFAMIQDADVLGLVTRGVLPMVARNAQAAGSAAPAQQEAESGN